MKEWLFSLNDLAKDIYAAEWRISDVLKKHTFSESQIAFLKTDGFEDFLHNIDFALQCRLLCGSNSVRFFNIIYQRYGLFGRTKQTLRAIGEEMGISHERVRQLQEKALRRLKPSKVFDVFETLIVISACRTLQIEPSVLLSVKGSNGDLDGVTSDTFEEYGEKAMKAPFSLSAEQCECIPYSEIPLAISFFVSRLNDMRRDPSKMDKLPYTEVVNWLVDNGYLEIMPSLKANGRTKAPTEKGKAIGISWEKQHSDTKNEDYMVALYNVGAQRFIVSNLDKIVLFAQQQKN